MRLLCAARPLRGAAGPLRALLPALLLCLAAAATARAADNTVYANDIQNPFGVYTVDPATGAISAAPVGNLSFSSIAMARRASDGFVFYTEYGVTNGRVATWNPTSGANVTIGTLGGGVRNFPRLAFNAAGTLYGMDDQGRLYTVNTGNGAAAVVGPNGNGGNIANFPDSIRGDMAFAPDGTLYATAGDNSTLYRIDIAALSATAVGPTGETLIAGNAFVNGGLLLAVESNASNTVSTLSLANGAASVVSTQAVGLYDLAAMPKFANLSVTKTTSSAFVAGSNASYTITVANAGPHTASGPVTVRDALPAGLTYVSATGTGWACANAGGVVTCTSPGSVTSGTTLPAITLNVTVGAAAAPSVTNTATVSSTTFDPVSTNDSSSVTSAVTLPTDLTVAKTHAGNFTQGQGGSYAITVTNSGGVASSGTVTVTDTLPAGLTPGPATGAGWTCGTSGQTVTCTRADALGGGASYPAITVPVAVATNSALSVTNTASVSGGGDSDTGNNTSSDPTTINGVPDLTAAKSHAGSFTRGATGSYTLTVGNAGGGATSGTVTVTDTLPAGLTPSTQGGTGWACGAAGQTVTCTRSDALAPGASYPPITLVVNVLQTAAASLTNTAAASGGGQTNTANDSANDPTAVVSSADLGLTKTVNNPNPVQGQNVTFTVTLTNAGPSNATNVAVTDALPAGLALVSATPSAGAYAAGTGLWTLASLDAGASATLQVVALVNNTGSITNTAQVTASDQPDPDSAPANNNPAEDDQASASIGAAAPPAVALEKSVTPSGTQLPGTELVYTVAFENKGGSPATAFVLTDPAGTLKINDYTDFKVGSVVNGLGTTGLTVTVEYSNDGGATWAYVPASAAGGAPAGYDRNVTHVRWTFGGTLAQNSPNNSGSVSFTVRIR
ncbi:MAG TPA: hypothetical protein VF659_22375 [Pyrinomonadaceae bacterium]